MRTKIGIFRRAAVERYSRPMESDVPELLAPMRLLPLIAGAALLLVAVWMLLR